MMIFSFLASAFLSAGLLSAGEPTQVTLFVLAGESNAVGYGADPAELPEHLQLPQQDVAFWFVEGPREAIDDPSLRIDSGGAFQPLAAQYDPSGATFGPLLEGFGPELAMGRTLAAELQGPVAILKFAFNDSSLAYDWNPGDPASLYHELIGEIAAAVTELEYGGFTVELGGVAWMQGESDALQPVPAWIYEGNLEELIEAARVDLVAPKPPFSFGMLNQFIDGEEEADFPYLYEVRDAQLAVNASVERTVLIDTDGFELGADGVHFAAAGQVALGEHFARAFLCAVSTYCSAQTNSLGCTPAIGSIGVPSLSDSTPFWITAGAVINQEIGMLLYGHQPNEAPFQGGTLCVLPPLRRTPPQATGGSAGPPDCTGQLAVDFKQLLGSVHEPALPAGGTVYAQYWYRDPGAPYGTGLTDGLVFTLLR